MASITRLDTSNLRSSDGGLHNAGGPSHRNFDAGWEKSHSFRESHEGRASGWAGLSTSHSEDLSLTSVLFLDSIGLPNARSTAQVELRRAINAASGQWSDGPGLGGIQSKALENCTAQEFKRVRMGLMESVHRARERGRHLSEAVIRVDRYLNAVSWRKRQLTTIKPDAPIVTPSSAKRVRSAITKPDAPVVNSAKGRLRSATIKPDAPIISSAKGRRSVHPAALPTQNATQTLNNRVQLGSRAQQQLRQKQQQQLQPRQQQQPLAQSVQANGSDGIQTPATGLGSNLSAMAGVPKIPMLGISYGSELDLQWFNVALQQTQDAQQAEQPHLFLKLAKEYMEAVEKMPSRNFNNEQCDYLVDKLKVVIQSASLFVESSRTEAHRLSSSVNIARHVETFQILLALANQIESFVQGCCKDAWIQAAMTLTNVAVHVSSIGSNLELCRIAFSMEPAATECLTFEQVVDINDAEIEMVKKKASADVGTLLARVTLELNFMKGGERDLASYLLQRLLRVQANLASLPSVSSLWGVNDEESFWGRLFQWVKPAERLGKGASATVHKGTWLGVQVAKKTFEGHENPDFMQEVGILGKLCHPNITSMFSCAKDKRWCAIIMELMDEDLHDLMRRRCNGKNDSPWPFPILEAVDIMLQIGEGVNYLHSQMVVHRDLKSFNILVKSVKERGVEIEYVHAKVADFGLSKTKESSIRYSNQTVNMGTNRWMAPEIINLNIVGGQASALEPNYPFKCDVYSFAMVCYEILTGYEPFFEERSAKKVKEKVLKGERPNLPDHCPPLLKALIEKCWIQEPRERPSFAFICSGLKYLKYLLMTGHKPNPHRTIEEQFQAAATEDPSAYNVGVLPVVHVDHISKRGHLTQNPLGAYNEAVDQKPPANSGITSSTTWYSSKTSFSNSEGLSQLSKGSTVKQEESTVNREELIVKREVSTVKREELAW